MKDYEGCARRYHEVKILKKHPWKESEQQRYGNIAHEAAEKYTRQGEKTPGFDFLWSILDALHQKPGVKFPEHKMALTEELVPCDWFAPEVWVRGIADLMIVDEDGRKAWVVDYKTGKDRYPDMDQLDLMSLLTFAHFPSIEQVNSALLFVVKNSMFRRSMKVAQRDAHWAAYRDRVARLEQSFETDVWNPTPSALCPWCPCTECPNHPE